MRTAAHQGTRNHARAESAQAGLVAGGEAQWDLVVGQGRSPIDHLVGTDPEIQQHGLLHPLVDRPAAAAVRLRDTQAPGFQFVQYLREQRAQAPIHFGRLEPVATRERVVHQRFPFRRHTPPPSPPAA